MRWFFFRSSLIDSLHPQVTPIMYPMTNLSAQLVTEPAMPETAPAAATPGGTQKRAKSEDVIELAPFTVRAGQVGGYQAQSSFGGRRRMSDLKHVASPAAALAPQFMEDLAIANTDAPRWAVDRFGDPEHRPSLQRFGGMETHR